MPVGLVFIL